MQYHKLPVRDFLREVRRGAVNLPEFYASLFTRLRALQKDYNFFVTLAEKEAFAQLGGLRQGKLQGLPVSAKDCLCTDGIQSSAGSRILDGYRPPFDATAVSHVKHEGGVIIGKTQQDEFGFGTFSVNSGFGTPRNPIDPNRTCGGSSGGAAGLVRALDAPHVALAESTGGSISAPASFCGVVGLTPTYGLVSRWGLIDYANSLDKIGVIAREVGDAALLLEAVAGFDDSDFTSLKTLKPAYAPVAEAHKPRIGIPREYFHGLDPQVERHVRDAVSYLERQGAAVKEVSLPHSSYGLAAYYIIATAEASTNLARYCGMRYGASLPLDGRMNEYFSRVRSRSFGEEAKRRIMLGTFARMAGYRGQYYLRALRVRQLIIRDFERVFRGRGAVDALLAPTMPLVAPRFSEIRELTPLQHYQMDTLTVGPNLAGIPHLSLPWGDVHGLPVGVHLLGDHLQENKLLAVAKLLENGKRRLAAP